MQFKRWVLKKQGDEDIIRLLMKEVNVSRGIANLLAQRDINGFNEAKNFFRPSLDQLHDPFLMKDMDKAVNRIVTAIEKKEKVLLYGDYDVDGTTAVATLYSFLRRFDLELDYYIPDRYSEGYGISFAGIDYAVAGGFSLVIALDCGIKAMEKIDYANEKKIEFIICDHHRPSDVLPDAFAVLDPERHDCYYPCKDLSGCGVGFKLAQAVAQQMKIPFAELEPLLDLVALSIAADIVPVTGENRILAHYGLKLINTNPRAGIEALLKTAGIKRRPDSLIKTNYAFTKEISISDLVFSVGPRVNAAGRIQSGKNSVDLLVATDMQLAEGIALQIDVFNVERKTLDSKATLEAIEMLPQSKNKHCTILFNEGWHKGVLGIVASRLTEHQYRPTIVFTRSNETNLITGSARSIKNFDIYEALDRCSDLLEHWGGHTFAAGLSLTEENLPVFVQRFEDYAASVLNTEMMTPVIEIDAELEFKDINPKFVNILKQFAPFGPGNMAPNFQTNGVCDNGYSKKVGNNHIKLFLTQPHFKGVGFPGIAFQLGDYFPKIEKGETFDIVYHIEENEWNGNVTTQLNVKDIKMQDNN